MYSFNQENSLSVYCIECPFEQKLYFFLLNLFFQKSDFKNSFIQITWESKFKKKKNICFTKIANLQLFEKKPDSEFLVLELDPGSRGQENNWLPDRFQGFPKIKIPLWIIKHPVVGWTWNTCSNSSEFCLSIKMGLQSAYKLETRDDIKKKDYHYVMNDARNYTNKKPTSGPCLK